MSDIGQASALSLSGIAAGASATAAFVGAGVVAADGIAKVALAIPETAAVIMPSNRHPAP
jgi:hypothetical protein